LKYKFRYHSNNGKTAEEIKEDIDRRNELRKMAKEQKLLEKNNLSTFKKPTIPIKYVTSPRKNLVSCKYVPDKSNF
jgi:hypothetical protein